MARNKFDIDETLETPFDIRHLKRALVYAGKYKGRIVKALLLSAVAVIIGLISPLITQYAIDNCMKSHADIPMLLLCAVAFLLCIILSVIFTKIRAKMMTQVGQDIIYDIRRDLFKHMQDLPFEYYDSRPHGKILVRVVNYINSISDLMTNGIINFVLEIFNLLFIIVFMFFVCWQLALVVLAGLPVYAAIIFAIKNRQRKAWQSVSNKSSNLNAYLHESIVGV
ncbi:MAG: ABC transporter ATP-binding protein, partial [Oscillospiraceae bacterium]|nr:ABC transporter ATP-binding protein [Oscillospiraceae bacterium]